MSDHVTNTAALAGLCAPWWASFPLTGVLQVVSIIWIVLQIANFFFDWRKPASHDGEGPTEH
jgi:hypothetical protein